MMRVRNRYRERVRSIGPRDLHARKEAHDHRVDLRLLGIADPHDGFFHEPGGIFADVETGARRGHDHNPARLAELQGRLRVFVDEHFLNCGAVGPVVGDQRIELRREMRQALGQRLCTVGFQLAVGDMLEAISFGFD